MNGKPTSSKTDLKKLAPKLSELHRLAEVGKLSGGFIHDLANHVTTMSLSMDRVEECLWRDSEKLRKQAAESARARKSIKYFVDALRKHMRGQDIHCYFSPERKLTELVLLFKYRAEKEKVSFCVLADSSAKNLRIYGSRIRFNQLFSNLISNAIDAFAAMPFAVKSASAAQNYYVKIRIRKKNDTAFITVSDNGPGMSAAVKKKVFEPFFTTKPDGKGVGLGLSTAKEIAERDFRGSISVRSTVGRGSSFCVKIPLSGARKKN